MVERRGEVYWISYFEGTDGMNKLKVICIRMVAFLNSRHGLQFLTCSNRTNSSFHFIQFNFHLTHLEFKNRLQYKQFNSRIGYSTSNSIQEPATVQAIQYMLYT